MLESITIAMTVAMGILWSRQINLKKIERLKPISLSMIAFLFPYRALVGRFCESSTERGYYYIDIPSFWISIAVVTMAVIYLYKVRKVTGKKSGITAILIAGILCAILNLVQA